MDEPDHKPDEGAAPSGKAQGDGGATSSGTSRSSVTVFSNTAITFSSSTSLHTSQTSYSTSTEPVSILGRGRHHSTTSSSGSFSMSPRPTVKFSEPDGSHCRDRTPDSPRFRVQGQESPKFKYHEGGGFKFKVHEGSSAAASQRSASHAISSIPESSAYSVSETSSYSSYTTESSKLVGTSYRCPDSPRNKTKITRTPHRNSIIASMELKVPSFHELPGPTSPGMMGSSLTPIMGHPESRGLTILSPHNPTPELHFSSTFTVRTRKGKTIVLPKLRIPAFHSHSHDSIFLG
ncbi:serine-rich adhesin for platelets-like [Macrobrachium rosenbergii]|uniref:serine-rich adhesin for platelets-like n=1 Tax=Macrobrachium rosenbergii TaxID=79674 RepID=UPI0034D595E3